MTLVESCGAVGQSGLGACHCLISFVYAGLAGDAVTRKYDALLRESKVLFFIGLALAAALSSIPFVVLQSLSLVSKIPGVGLNLLYGGITLETMLLSADIIKAKMMDGNKAAWTLTCLAYIEVLNYGM